jgi:hypothetical protein
MKRQQQSLMDTPIMILCFFALVFVLCVFGREVQKPAPAKLIKLDSNPVPEPIIGYNTKSEGDVMKLSCKRVATPEPLMCKR